MLPGKIDIRAAEVTVGSRLSVDRAAQVQHADDACRTKVKVPADDPDNLLIVDLAGAEGIHIDRGRLRHADRVGELNFHAVRISCRDQVLGDIARRVRRGAVNLRAVLAGEGSAAVTADTAVGIDDNLASCQTGIAVRAADDKTSRRIDKYLGVRVNHRCVHNRIDDILADILVNLFLRDLLVVLGGDDNRLETDRLIVLIVLDGNLRLAVCAEIRKRTVLAHLGQPAGQLVCEIDGIRHVFRRLVGGIAEHHALIAGADRLDLRIGHLVLSRLKGLVHAHRDIRRLLIQRDKDRAGVRIEAFAGIVIADLPDRIADNLLIIYNSLGRDLAGHQDKTCAGSSLACHTAHGILCHAGIQNRIGYSIADFVGMSFCHRLRRENVLLHFRNLLRFVNLVHRSAASGPAGSGHKKSVQARTDLT